MLMRISVAFASADCYNCVGLEKPNSTRYAICFKGYGRGNTTGVCMHTEVWTHHDGPVPDGLSVDHRNRDGLDNRRENLRLATTAQQGYNKAAPAHTSTGYKGVHWASGPKRFKSFIRHTTDEGRMRFYLGSYLTAEEAACAYNHAALRLHGDFANLNEIPEGAIDDVRSEEILWVVLDRLTKPVSAH